MARKLIGSLAAADIIESFARSLPDRQTQWDALLLKTFHAAK
jgi:hypothetical protein